MYYGTPCYKSLLAGLTKILVMVFFIFGMGSAHHPAASQTIVEAEKWLSEPKLDGSCRDEAYLNSNSVSLVDVSTKRTVAEATIVHSTRFLYLCIARGITLGDHLILEWSDQAGLPKPGNRIEVGADGSVVVSIDRQSAPLRPRAESPTAVSVSNGGGGLEIKINLELLGGFAHKALVRISLVQRSGHVLARWPQGQEAPMGQLVLSPSSAVPVKAGSLFVDGSQGYLVVGRAADLSPQEITVEAWVKPSRGACGPVVSHGAGQSYWLAICDRQTFGFDNKMTKAFGTIRIQPDEWHHVAVSMDADGMRTYYVDGVLDAVFGAEQDEDKHPPNGKLQGSNEGLRIGFDPALRDMPGYVGHIRDLRIWNTPRTRSQLVRTAFARPTVADKGLIAWWPFTSGLGDATGKHKTGVIGSASLATEAPSVQAFASPPPARLGLKGELPKFVSPWQSMIPASVTPVEPQGGCGRGGRSSARLTLEPGHTQAVQMRIVQDSLYVCMLPMFGGPQSSLIIAIDRSGHATTGDDPAILKMVVSATGDVQSNVPAGPNAPTARIMTAPRMPNFEDIDSIQVPVWFGEVRVPLTALAPFRVREQLKFAVFYKGQPVPAAKDAVKIAAATPWSGVWPAGASLQDPSKWSLAGTGGELTNVPELQWTHPANDAHFGHSPAPLPPPPGQSSPTKWDDFYACAPTNWPLWEVDSDLKWPPVGGLRTDVLASGTLSSIDYSDEDSIFLHNSHDLDMVINLDQQYLWLGLNNSTDNGSPIPQQAETESGGLPAEYRPVPNDRVTVGGTWIFDCGHDFHTELHPLFFVESDWDDYAVTQIGSPPSPVRKARVWMNSDPGSKSKLLVPVTFTLPLPVFYGGVHPFLAVTSGDPNNISAHLINGGLVVEITVSPPSSQGAYGWMISTGYLHGNPPAEMSPRLYTVTLDRMDILYDHDDGARGSGEWFMDANINGQGLQLFTNGNDGATDTGATVDLGVGFPVFAVYNNRDIRFHVNGYEDDDGFDEPGGLGNHITTNDQTSTPFWSLGDALLTAGTGQKPFDPVPNPDWRLWYHVDEGANVPPVLADQVYWSQRLAGEPNDGLYSTGLGLITVPDVGMPSAALDHPAFVTAFPMQHDGVTLLGTDVDNYSFQLSDFADVVDAPLPAGLHGNLEMDAVHGCANLGATSGHYRVEPDNSDPGEIPYSVRLNAAAKVLPPDWGVSMDSPGTGRPVDLKTPDPDAHVGTVDLGAPVRDLTKPCAWQHVPNETHYYRVSFPADSQRPLNCPPGTGSSPINKICKSDPPCEFDTQSSLIVGGTGMHVAVAGSGQSADDSLAISDLDANLPNHEIVVQVSSKGGRVRNVYQFFAQWNGGVKLTAKQCAFQRLAKRTAEIVAGMDLRKPAYLQGVYDLHNPGDPIERLQNDGDFGIQVDKQGIELPFQAGAKRVSTTIYGQTGAEPVIARLYDASGLLVTESSPAVQQLVASNFRTTSMIPVSAIDMKNLVPGAIYRLRLVLDPDVVAKLQADLVVKVVLR